MESFVGNLVTSKKISTLERWLNEIDQVLDVAQSSQGELLFRCLYVTKTLLQNIETHFKSIDGDFILEQYKDIRINKKRLDNQFSVLLAKSLDSTINVLKHAAYNILFRIEGAATHLAANQPLENELQTTTIINDFNDHRKRIAVFLQKELIENLLGIPENEIALLKGEAEKLQAEFLRYKSYLENLEKAPSALAEILAARVKSLLKQHTISYSVIQLLSKMGPTTEDYQLDPELRKYLVEIKEKKVRDTGLTSSNFLSVIQNTRLREFLYTQIAEDPIYQFAYTSTEIKKIGQVVNDYFRETALTMLSYRGFLVYLHEQNVHIFPLDAKHFQAALEEEYIKQFKMQIDSCSAEFNFIKEDIVQTDELLQQLKNLHSQGPLLLESPGLDEITQGRSAEIERAGYLMEMLTEHKQTLITLIELLLDYIPSTELKTQIKSLGISDDYAEQLISQRDSLLANIRRKESYVSNQLSYVKAIYKKLRILPQLPLTKASSNMATDNPLDERGDAFFANLHKKIDEESGANDSFEQSQGRNSTSLSAIQVLLKCIHNH